MDKETAKAQFLALTEDDKRIVLASLAHELTICARSAYLEQADITTRFQTLQTFNEMQHQVSSQLRNKLLETDKTYPDDVLVDIVFDIAHRADAEDDLLWAFGWALQRYAERSGARRS